MGAHPSPEKYSLTPIWQKLLYVHQFIFGFNNIVEFSILFQTLLGREGAQRGFYSGRIASAIVSAVAEHGGVLTLPDLHAHRTAFE